MNVSRLLCVLLLTSSFSAFGESKNPADYPLRIHILGRQQMVVSRGPMIEEAKGDGRANLFENDTVHAVNFSYDCSEKLRTSFGFETYPARWKKPNQELVVLIPVFGKSNTYFTCNLKTDVKDTAYATTPNGQVISETPEQYKDWMMKHDYDPEHGKNTPTRLAGGPQTPVPAQSAPPQQ